MLADNCFYEGSTVIVTVVISYNLTITMVCVFDSYSVHILFD